MVHAYAGGSKRTANKCCAFYQRFTSCPPADYFDALVASEAVLSAFEITILQYLPWEAVRVRSG